MGKRFFLALLVALLALATASAGVQAAGKASTRSGASISSGVLPLYD